ncbi:hypothetical protein CDAR_388811 [Caerostris darwini]|uniref:Uncharacterized protein n=1 Tax=Caerostris darwini TaxID=1538125 RepID=A0AAV4S3Z4_9ARAC|nr:hypothetical protein CDAR_388811 [Caerostris darwini]
MNRNKYGVRTSPASGFGRKRSTDSGNKELFISLPVTNCGTREMPQQNGTQSTIKGRLLRHFSAAAELRMRWKLTASVSFLVAIVHCPVLLRNGGRILNTDIRVGVFGFLRGHVMQKNGYLYIKCTLVLIKNKVKV